MLPVFKEQIATGDMIELFFIDGKSIQGKVEKISEQYVIIKTEIGKTTITENEFNRNIGRWNIIENPTNEQISQEAKSQEDNSQVKNTIIDTFLGEFPHNISKTKLVIFEPDYSSLFSRNLNKTQHDDWNLINNRFQHAKKSNQDSGVYSLIETLNKLSKEFPQFSVIPYNAGCFSYYLKNFDTAISFFKKAYSMDHNPKYLNNLIVSEIEKKEYSKAMNHLNIFFSEALPWDNSDEWHTLISLTIITNNLCEFQDTFKKIIVKLSSKKISINDSQSLLLFKTIVLLLKNNQQTTDALNLIDLFNENSEIISKTLNLIEVNFDLKTISKQEMSLLNQETIENQSPNHEIIIIKQEPEKGESDPSGKTLPIRGRIYSYKNDRNYGFISDDNNNWYFFHRSAIIDDDVITQLSNLKWDDELSIDVFFEKTIGPRGPIAIQITSPKTTDELFKIANTYAENGEFENAINYIKQVIFFDSTNVKARDLLVLWKKYIQIPNLPRENTPYAKAVRAQIAEKDVQRAELFFLDAINEKDNFDNSVLELATLYSDENRYENAIQLLKKYIKRLKTPRSAENLLATVYRRTEKYDALISLLETQYQKSQNNIDKGQILLQIGNAYLHLNKFEDAEKTYIHTLEILPENLSARRNMAICLFKQNKLNEAEAILNKILDRTYDASALDLKNAISDARKTGQSSQFEEIITEAVSSDYSSDEITEFAQFFLSAFDISVILPNRIVLDPSGNMEYNSSEKDALNDIQYIEKAIKSIKTSNPKEIANYNLAAAWVCSRIIEDRNKFYEYLNKAFSYYGDNAVQENRQIDAIKSWYCEALIAFDKSKSTETTEQIALDDVSKFLYATLGKKFILLSNTLPLNIVLPEIFAKSPNSDMIFDAIGYLIFKSEFASKKILSQLYNNSAFRENSIQYLKKKGVPTPPSIDDIKDFVNHWDKYRRALSVTDRKIKNDFQLFKNKPFNQIWLENLSQKIPLLKEDAFFKEDKERLLDLNNIVENFKEYFLVKSFEEKEHLLIQISNDCKGLIREIQESPTQISIMGIFPLSNIIQNQAVENLNILYQTSVANLNVRLAIPTYYPHNDEIEIQLAIENQIGCSPADNIELIPVDYDGDLFGINEKDLKIIGSLRGGAQIIVKIKLSLHEKTVVSREFSFSVYGQYQCYSTEIKRTEIQDFKIQIFPEAEFSEIKNPYSQYAAGTIVKSPEMFFGRGELINNIFSSIQNSRNQSKCIIIFGQKRSGKSSILYHLKIMLKNDPTLIVLDLGSLGSIMDNPAVFHYNLLWSILRTLRDSLIEMSETNKIPKLKIEFPSDVEFFSHPSPQVKFMEIFDKFNQIKEKDQDWRDKRVVLLIDEFSYIYNEIVTEKIPHTFMKLWKALVEKNYFGAVLVGQDVMEKFKHEYPNEFGAIQDERVSYLSYDDSKKLIDEPIRINGTAGKSRYKEKAIDKIFELTAGNPYFIQIICNRLVRYMTHYHKNYVTEADVDQIKQDIIFGANAFRLADFDSLSSSGDNSPSAIKEDDIVNVLRVIATNCQNDYCSRSNIDIVTETPIDEILNELVERKVIEKKKSNYYDIKVKLFKEWLIAHP